MRPTIKTKLECALYAVLAASCLSACGLFLQPVPTGPVGPAGGLPAPSASPGANANVSPQPSQPRGGEIAFTRLTFQRSTSDPEAPLPKTENLRIRTKEALAAFLDQLGADTAGRPTVDFSSREVLAFYDKAGGSGCSDAKLEQLFEAANEVRYVYGSADELHPDPNRGCTQIFIYPHYDLYAMPASDKTVQNFTEFQPPAGGTGAMPAVRDGFYSQITAFRTVTAKTETEWKTLYKEHAPDEAAPTVDFSKQMIVGVFLGERNAGGYAVGIKSAVESGNSLNVEYFERKPQGGSIQVLTQPFSLVAVAKSDKPVTFEKVDSP
jgi:hypothetical protein